MPDEPPPPESETPAPTPAAPKPPPIEPEKLTTMSVRAIVRDERVSELVEAFSKLSPIGRAELFMRVRLREKKVLLSNCPPEIVAGVLADADSAALRPALVSLDLASLEPALKLVAPDDLADIVHHLPPIKGEEVLRLVGGEMAETVRGLLKFDPDSAGGMMNPQYLSVPEVVTVGRALEILRKAKIGDSPSYVYVVGLGGKLVGTVGLRDLVMSDARQPIRKLVRANLVRARASAPREELVRLFKEHHFVSLPVVDDQDRVLGIVAFDDVMAEMRQEEARVVMGVTGADPREALRETLVAARRRIVWVTVTIRGGLSCAFVAGLFRATLDEVVWLSVFLPLVLALGESVGSQTTSVVLTLLIGAGSSPREALAGVLLRELGIAAVAGAYAGTLVAAASLLWNGNPWLGAVIGGSIFLSVAWAGLLGVVIPGAVVRLRADPAIASGPLVLALADLSTLAIYFGSATLIVERLR